MAIKKTGDENMSPERGSVPVSAAEEKKRLRRTVRDRRDRMRAEERREADRMLVMHLLSLRECREASVIYAFASFGSECSTDAFIRHCLREGKCVALPRVEGEVMHFGRIDSPESLVPGVWGIPEPPGHAERICSPGFMLVPGIAFDKKGYRLGYGGGYYDKYLAEHPGNFTAGIAYEIQMTAEVPRDEFDIKTDLIITEKGILRT